MLPRTKWQQRRFHPRGLRKGQRVYVSLVLPDAPCRVVMLSNHYRDRSRPTGRTAENGFDRSPVWTYVVLTFKCKILFDGKSMEIHYGPRDILHHNRKQARDRYIRDRNERRELCPTPPLKQRESSDCESLTT